MILAGDIGGTKCNLALYEIHGKSHRKIIDQRYESREFPTFDEMISKFLFDTRAETKAAGAALHRGGGFRRRRARHRSSSQGDQSCPGSSMPRALAKQLGTPHVVLLNDLEATAHSLALMAPSELSTLNQGMPSPQSTQALLAAGTGLGEAILFWDGKQYLVASSEGGHTDFAPRTEQEIELLRYMKKQYEFVSVELILSGRGFRTIHSFLDASVNHPSFEGPEADAAPEITRLALAGQCPVCVQTLDLWVSHVRRRGRQSGAEGSRAGRSLGCRRNCGEDTQEDGRRHVFPGLLREGKVRRAFGANSDSHGIERRGAADRCDVTGNPGSGNPFRLRISGGLHAARGFNFDRDFVADPQKEIARVLQSPLHIGNFDVSRDLQIPCHPP